jgi:hypothetical protein
MGLYDLFFRRWPPIREQAELADFIDEQSAFLVQKGIYEYSRARAGHYSKVMFAEAEFQAAVEKSRWGGYPLGLALLGEMVAGVLQKHAEDRRAIVDALTPLVLSVFDRYPIPQALGPGAWRGARQELSLRLDRVGTHPPKPVKDIPVPLAENYFNLMPIHENFRGPDFPTLRNYMRITLINSHDEFVKRLDAPALMHDLGLRPR